MNNDSESTATIEKTTQRTNNERTRAIQEEPSNGEKSFSSRNNEKKRDSFLPPI